MKQNNPPTPLVKWVPKQRGYSETCVKRRGRRATESDPKPSATELPPSALPPASLALALPQSDNKETEPRKLFPSSAGPPLWGASRRARLTVRVLQSSVSACLPVCLSVSLLVCLSVCKCLSVSSPSVCLAVSPLLEVPPRPKLRFF